MFCISGRVSFLAFAVFVAGLAHADPQESTKPAFHPNQTLEEIRSLSHGDISAVELLRQADLRRGQDTRSKIFDFALMLKKRGNTTKTRKALEAAIEAMRSQAVEHTTNTSLSDERSAALLKARIAFLDEMQERIPTFLDLSEASFRTILKQSVIEAQGLFNARAGLDPLVLWERTANLADLLTLLNIANRPDWGFLEITGIRVLSAGIFYVVLTAGGDHPGTLDFISAVVSMTVVPGIFLRPYNKWKISAHAHSTNEWIREATQGSSLASSSFLKLRWKLRDLADEIHRESCAKALTSVESTGGGIESIF